jgi:aspartate racemase
MGPQASTEFYRLLIEGARHRYGARTNQEYPEILIDSVPVPDFLAGTKHMETAARILEDRVRRLTDFGASVITMACNTACLLTNRLQKHTDVPIISVVEEVVRTVSKERKRVLLLASPTSLKLGLYQLALARYGISYVVPCQREYQEIEMIIRGVIDGADQGALMRRLVKIARRYVEKGDIQGIVLGCTELPLVFPINYRLPVYSSLSILAEALLKMYYRKENL